jgi:hypothetical protein
MVHVVRLVQRAGADRGPDCTRAGSGVT